MMKITQLHGEAWNNAIDEVITLLNDTLNTKLFRMRDKYQVEELAEKLDLEFFENGRLVRK